MGLGQNGLHVLGNGQPAAAAEPGNTGASPGGAVNPLAGPGRSGRGFVIVLVLLLAGLSLALLVLFRQWRSQYSELSAYGADRVAAAIAPLVKTVPSAVSPEEWEQIVNQAREALVEVTASGALNVMQMRSARQQIQERINGVRPEIAAETLAALWLSLEDQAGPLLSSRDRSGVSTAVHPLGNLQPPNVGSEAWALALVQTRAMLVALNQPKPLPKPKRDLLRTQIDALLQGTTPERAPSDLRKIWDLVREDHALPAGFSACVLDTHAASLSTPAATAP